jgi:hypothetical protein
MRAGREHRSRPRGALPLAELRRCPCVRAAPGLGVGQQGVWPHGV